MTGEAGSFYRQSLEKDPEEDEANITVEQPSAGAQGEQEKPAFVAAINPLGGSRFRESVRKTLEEYQRNFEMREYLLDSLTNPEEARQFRVPPDPMVETEKEEYRRLGLVLSTTESLMRRFEQGEALGLAASEASARASEAAVRRSELRKARPRFQSF